MIFKTSVPCLRPPVRQHRLLQQLIALIESSLHIFPPLDDAELAEVRGTGKAFAYVGMWNSGVESGTNLSVLSNTFHLHLAKPANDCPGRLLMPGCTRQAMAFMVVLRVFGFQDLHQLA